MSNGHFYCDLCGCPKLDCSKPHCGPCLDNFKRAEKQSQHDAKDCNCKFQGVNKASLVQYHENKCVIQPTPAVERITGKEIEIFTDNARLDNGNFIERSFTVDGTFKALKIIEQLQSDMASKQKGAQKSLQDAAKRIEDLKSDLASLKAECLPWLERCRQVSVGKSIGELLDMSDDDSDKLQALIKKLEVQG